jgi:hypothetical protein
LVQEHVVAATTGTNRAGGALPDLNCGVFNRKTATIDRDPGSAMTDPLSGFAEVTVS